MQEFFNVIKDWVVDLGDKHGVDPLVIFCLYLCSKISLFTCLGWAINNIRLKKPFVPQLLFAGISFCVPYTYVMIVGRNIAPWVYVVIGLIFVLGVYSIWKKISVKVDQPVP
jgi:hypothetical protein